MTDLPKLIEEMRAGLENPSFAGPVWICEVNDTSVWIGTPKGEPPFQKCEHVLAGFSTNAYSSTARQAAVEFHQHIARCSPKNITALLDNHDQLVKAGKKLLPYLEFTVGPESPGHHPTMPSAIAEFRAALKAAGALQEGVE